MNKLGKHDLVGRMFKHLVVLERVEKPENVEVGKYTYWRCLCDCGNEIIVSRYSLNDGKISCGCIKKPRAKETRKRKEYSNKQDIPQSLKRIRNIWYKMKSRCFNLKDNEYHNYGAKGIVVCDRWLDFESFKEDMYESYLEFEKVNGENSATIDRINSNGNYEPSNCRWATQLEQARNRSNNIGIEVDGIFYGTLSQLAEAYGISYGTIRNRYSRGERGLDLIRKDNLKLPIITKDSNKRLMEISNTQEINNNHTVNNVIIT